MHSLAALKNMTEGKVCNSADIIAKENVRASDAGKYFVVSPLKQKNPSYPVLVLFCFFFLCFRFQREREQLVTVTCL